jgi:IS4 transposase
MRSDQIGKLTLARSRAAFPWPLRKVHYFDAETGRDLIFLTNHLEIPAVVVAGIYRRRWQIELFFRWIKGHLRIKHFFGNSPNAVTTYLLVAIIHKHLGLPGNLHRTLQLLSVHPFEKMPVHELFTETEFNAPPTSNPNQLLLSDL